MDDEFFNHFIAGLKPTTRKRILLSSAESFEKACIAVEHAGVVFAEYKGTALRSLNDSTYTDCGIGYTPVEDINQIINAKPSP